MQNHNNSLSPVSQITQKFHQIQLVGNIQMGGRFVQKYIVRILGQSHGNIGSLTHTSGQGLQGFLCILGNAGLFHGICGDFPVFGAVASGIAQVGKSSMQHQLLHGHIRCCLFLRKIGDLPGNFISGHFPDGFALCSHPATGVWHHAQNGFQQGTFAGAVYADDAGDVSLFKGHGQVLQHLVFSVAGRNLV